MLDLSFAPDDLMDAVILHMLEHFENDDAKAIH
jgi:hypothetical protein